MLKKTDTVLARADYNTKSLTIADDTSLGVGDIHLIGEVIARCPQLESLTIKDCKLSSEEMEPIVAAVYKHPSVSALDFSGNAFTDVDFMVPLAGLHYNSESQRWVGNRRINAVDLSGNAEPFDKGSVRRLLVNVLEADHLAVLKIDVDPWEASGSIDKKIEAASNLVDATFNIEGDTEFFFREALSANDKRKFVDECQSGNLAKAQQILQRVESAQMISDDDLMRVNKRMAAVLYLAQKKYGRAKALEVLYKFHDHVKAATGSETTIGKYMVTAEGGKPSAPAPTVFAAPEADASDIDAIVKSLPGCTREGVTGEIAQCRANPTRFLELGGDTLRAMARVSTTSLTVMTGMPTLQSPVTLMEKFTGRLGGVVNALQQVSGKSIGGSMTAAGNEVAKPKGWLATLLDPVHAPTHLRAVAPLANEAAQSLRDMVPEMQAVADAIGTELTTTNTVVDAYGAIKDRLQIYVDAGRAVSQTWKAEYKAKNPDASADGTPFYIRALDDRVSFLNDARDRVSAHSGNHIIHAALLQKHRQQTSMAVEQNLPLLGASVEGLARQLVNSRPGSSDINAAVQSVRAIDRQAGSVMEVMRRLEKTGEDVRAHIGDLFLDRALATSGASQSTPPAAAAGTAPSG
jgi:hypothetical protein